MIILTRGKLVQKDEFWPKTTRVKGRPDIGHRNTTVNCSYYTNYEVFSYQIYSFVIFYRNTFNYTKSLQNRF